MPSTEELKPIYCEGQFDDAEVDCPKLFEYTEPEASSLNLGEWEELEGEEEIEVENKNRVQVIEEYYSDDDFDIDEDNWGGSDYASSSVRETLQGPVVAGQRSRAKFNQSHFDARVCLEQYTTDDFRNSALNTVSSTDIGNTSVRKDKANRATVSGALDPRTMRQIYSLVNSGKITDVHGCISSGKEANIYYCRSTCADYGGSVTNPIECILKVHKTVLTGFKRRSGYNEKNKHGRTGATSGFRMIQDWSEREYSHLHKLHKANIPVPKPYCHKSHIVLMEFLKEFDQPAPQLKDVKLGLNQAREVYSNLIIHMRDMYQKCAMVHADLSEYNILYYNQAAYIIDVSQSVSPNHPEALEHLRKDCTNVTELFRRRGVSTLTIKELFMFIVDKNITDDNIDEYLEKCRRICNKRDPLNMTHEEQVEENTFKQVFLPKCLNEVIDFEAAHFSIHSGLTKSCDLDYQTVIGMRPDLSGASEAPTLLINGKDKECKGKKTVTFTEEIDESEKEDNDDEDKNKEDLTRVPSELSHPDRKKGETLEEKKNRKKRVKDAQAQKRIDSKKKKCDKKAHTKKLK